MSALGREDPACPNCMEECPNAEAGVIGGREAGLGIGAEADADAEAGAEGAAGSGRGRGRICFNLLFL